MVRLPLPVHLYQVFVAARDAEGGQAPSIHVLQHAEAAGFDLVLGREREFGGEPADPALSDITHGFFVEAHHLQCLTVGVEAIVRLLQRDGIVRKRLVQLGGREGLRIVGELLAREAAQRVHPLSWAHLFRSFSQHRHRLFPRGDAVQTDLVLPARTSAQEVHMVIDQSGNEGLALQVDRSGARPRQWRDRLIAADGYHSVAPDGHSLRNREFLVHGDDLPVGQNEVRRRPLRVQHRTRGGAQEQRAGQNHLPCRGHSSLPMQAISLSPFDSPTYCLRGADGGG